MQITRLPRIVKNLAIDLHFGGSIRPVPRITYALAHLTSRGVSS
jgi:hypothetical protein